MRAVGGARTHYDDIGMVVERLGKLHPALYYKGLIEPAAAAAS